MVKKNTRKVSKNSRRASRKANRKVSRKVNRKAKRVVKGGAYDPMALSMNQGKEFLEMHAGQRGGAYLPPALGGAPVGYTGMLPSEMADAARVSPTLNAFGEISGMRDPDQVPAAVDPAPMKGGRRKAKKAAKKSKKSSKKSKKAAKKSKKAAKKSKKASRSRSRKAMRGGMAPINAPGMLLSASMAARAGTGDFSNPLLKA